ncbi:sensor histidine kinase [Pseudoduganella armeniaca]|uniref:histidine kinase n=1 Tax=Pseudoduganella armeniaca TaxID=2072590 RepID=A0A2R4CAR2_9BURK|nr:ATP-binding protein [Pseudoduganella armeniaca]AVR96737.1 two-component sensor histidine kinase [Pseudoduganella armeniaca]
MGRLFWKFFLSILLAQVAATVGIGGALWLKNRASTQERRLDIDTGPPAELAIEAAAATLDAGGPAALARLLENMGRHRVFAVDSSGKELLGRIVDATMLAEARALLAKGDTRVVRKVTLPNGRPYLLFLPARERQRGLDARNGDDGRPLLPGLVDVSPRPGRPPDGARPPPRDDRPPGPPGPRFRPLTPFVPLAAAVLASLLFAALLAWYFARPIRALRQAFEAASHGDLAPRFARVDRTGDELSDLGRDFDRMTARLRQLMDGQTRLLHDVSHELRSPLARLQAAIGLAHQKPERVLASLQRIERESVRMDKLVGELLTLARLEAGALAPGSQEIDVAELLYQIVADAQFEASAQGRAVLQEGEAEVTMLGEPDLLARAIENVVRNAIKHSPVGATVVVAAQATGPRLCIQVLDRGPGVADSDLATIFQPFFRSSGTEKDVEGHGLGLAIAQQVVRQHGGTIVASNRAGGGLCVEIVLPLD